MTIALIGRAGSGKSTVAKRLADEYGKEIIGSDMFRDYIAAQKDGWEQVQAYMKIGKMLPADLLEKAFLLKLEKCTGDKGFVIDGIKVCNEMQMLEEVVGIDKVLYLKADATTAAERAETRGRPDFCNEFLESREKLFQETIDEILNYYADKLSVIDASLSPEDVWRQVQAALSTAPAPFFGQQERCK